MPTVSFNQHFPGYEILGELSRSNARVLKARNQLTGELVAIKHFAINTDHETITRFQRESGIMTSINHPNIVKIKEMKLDADLPYIVMELIEGGDLRSLLKEKGSLDVATTVRLGSQMAQAFRAIHEKGIIHRDIKPENIMYRILPSGEYHFLLTDFGIAKLREQSTTVTGTSLMTYEYASPEQFDNPKSVSAATDYYSLGVVMYECLAGRVPFPLVDGRVHTLIKQVMDAPPPSFRLPASMPLPRSMEKLITKMLAKKEADRVKDPLTLLRMLKHAEMEELGEPVPDEPAPAVATLQPSAKPVPLLTAKAPAQRSSVGLGLALAFVIILAIIIVVVIVQQKKEYNADKNQVSQKVDSITADPAAALPDSGTRNDLSGNDKPGTQFSQEPMLRLADGNFEERFTNNDNRWPAINTSETQMGIQDELYRIKGISPMVFHRALKDFALDMNKNFSVTLYAKWVSGVTDNGYGLYFCSDRADASYYCFLISENGHYTIQHKKGSMDWEVLKDWTASSHINQDGRWNLLRVDKQDNALHFYINNIFVEQLPFTGEFGTSFGMGVSEVMTVEFDDLVIKSMNTDGTDNTDFAR